MSRVNLTPTQAAAASTIIRDLGEAGHPVELARVQGSRTVRIFGTDRKFDVGGRGKVTKV